MHHRTRIPCRSALAVEVEHGKHEGQERALGEGRVEPERAPAEEQRE